MNNNDDNTEMRNNQKQKAKKLTITLALDERIVKQIRMDADDSNQSLNTRINSILTKHVKFYRMMEASGSGILHPTLIQFIIDEMDENKFIAHWKSVGLPLVRSFFAQQGWALTIDSFINHYLELASYAGVITRVTKYIDADDGKTCIFLSHAYDTKWSRIIGAAYSSEIQHLLNVQTRIRVFPDGVEIKILEKLG